MDRGPWTLDPAGETRPWPVPSASAAAPSRALKRLYHLPLTLQQSPTLNSSQALHTERFTLNSSQAPHAVAAAARAVADANTASTAAHAGRRCWLYAEAEHRRDAPHADACDAHDACEAYEQGRGAPHTDAYGVEGGSGAGGAAGRFEGFVDGWEASVQCIVDALRVRGPFDGLLGLSQVRVRVRLPPS